MVKKIFLSVIAIFIFVNVAFAGELAQIRITANNVSVIASLENNPTSTAFYNKLPLTLHMKDLYKRELCFFSPTAYPTGQLTASSYKVGDLIYWPPRHCIVILYKQNGERFQRQHMGHIETGAELFENIGDVEVTFEKVEKATDIEEFEELKF